MKKSRFADKRNEWLDALNGTDVHSIHNQLTQMAWDAASFAVINEARRLAPPADEGVKLNGLMHMLINRGFFVGQAAAIRRLVDVSGLKGPRGVFSLRGLIEDMIQHRSLMTRQAIFDAEGRPYDYEPVRRQAEKYFQNQTKAGKRSFGVPKHLVWQRHERRHEQIDGLSNTKKQNRKPNDTIAEDVFQKLIDKAATACKDVKEYVDKFIAHSATPSSRAKVSAGQTRITLNHLEKAHRSLCEITAFLAICILGDSCAGFLPTPQYDHLQYIENPLICKDQKPKLLKLWQKLDRDYSAMSNWGLDEYRKEFGI